ncbi:MAG TPA: DNA alkylation repair protein [Candidatus Bathyarchaeia archaeon]|jgi:3-methyladenine DNA glycosylase AlkD|nr:DNA alkylation repair protein [Candidatus Bathyarchaeia archaeon]
MGAAVAEAIDALKRLGSKAGRDGMARYGLPSDKAFGVSVKDVQSVAKKLGKDHGLAAALWRSGWHEARMLACYVDEPERVTPAQMDAWAKDFDNWGICDTVCFVLFDKTPHAWKKVETWSKRKEEFVRRAAFALLWGLTVHDKEAEDARFTRGLSLIEAAATDDRHYVKKAVNMALRATGKRNPELRVAALATARKLALLTSESARWVGRDALRELSKRP